MEHLVPDSQIGEIVFLPSEEFASYSPDLEPRRDFQGRPKSRFVTVVGPRVQEPPPGPGRKVVRSYPDSNGGWLRLEHVSCGSNRCKKQPDEHGPYWYRYQRVGSGWRSTYLGRQSPGLPEQPIIQQVHEHLVALSKQDTLSDEELLEIDSLITGLVQVEGQEARELREKGVSLLERESARRREVARERHEFLLRRALSRKELTKEERGELRTTTEILSWEH